MLGNGMEQLVEPVAATCVSEILQKVEEVSSWVVNDSTAFSHNIAAYKAIVGNDAQLAVVLKSNAYGHGLEIVAKLVDENKAVDLICVVSVSEALRLRFIGIQKPILVVSILDGDLVAAVKQRIQLVVYNKESLHRIQHASQLAQKIAQIHLKFDTGLSRLGVGPDDWHEFVASVAAFKKIDIVGIFTHLADAESNDQQFSKLQLERFRHAQHLIAEQLGYLPLIHYSCSAALGTLNSSSHSIARFGIGLYGLWSSVENKAMMKKLYPSFSLRPVMSWYSRIIQLKSVSAGASIGYDMSFIAPVAMRLAIVSVGYWDGFDRCFSNNGVVCIAGQLACVVGRVSMNLTIVDVTHIAHVQEQDPVLLLGNMPGVRAEDLAERAGTINYEIVTRINPLLPRCIF